MMKTALISISVLLLSFAAHADEASNAAQYSHQFLAKRPYSQVLANAAAKQTDTWEAATYIADQAVSDIETRKNQQVLRVNMLARRSL